MKKLLALAAFLLASSTAQAQYQFEYGGRTIKIDPDRGTVSIPGVYDNTKKSKGAKTEQKQPPPTTAPAPAAPAVATQQPLPPPPAPAPAPAQAPLPEQPATTTANNAPPDNNTLPPPPPPAPPPLPTTSALPPIQADQPPTAPQPPAPPPPAPTVAAAPPPPPPPAAPAQRQVTPAAAAPAAAPRDPNSPVGVWQTEEKEGKIRIEQCGTNLCGYSVDAKTNLNGEQVLINMKPGKDQKWSGRILDPNTGSTYDSSITLKSPDALRVQGCAFGGMFCGGQNWTRVN
jgi:uncharacterized protein (DUF2147 family)